MSAGILHSHGGRRDLLPDAIGSGLIGWLRRSNGLGLLAFAALGWIGLLSWEMPVAGQSSGGGGAISHLVGKMPALVADFLLQSFGVAAALMFAIPTFWGLEQLARQRLGRPLLRLLMWPSAVLAAAGGLSALPAPGNWPFARGLGGVVGDQLFTLLRLALSPAGPTAAAAAAGLVLGAAALALFATSIGVHAAVAHPGVADELDRTRDGEFEGSNKESNLPAGDFEPSLEATPDEEWRSEPAPRVRMAPPQKGRAPAFTRPDTASVAVDSENVVASQQPIHVPYDDMPEDDESRAMAQRFAPAGSRLGSNESDASGEPQPWFGWKDLLGRATDAVVPLANAAAQAARPVMQTQTQTARYEDLPSQVSTPDLDQQTVLPGARAWPDSALPYRLPTANLLSRLPAQGLKSEAAGAELVAMARRLEAALSEFGVRAQIVGAVAGPIVTQFEIQTAPGTKPTRVVGLAEDLARAMGARSARVAPMPARATLLIELPNLRPDPMALRDLLETKSFRQSMHALPLAVGIAVDRQPIVTDLATVPGLLVSGAAGTGKSKALGAMIAAMLLRFAPGDLRLLLIDPRNQDLSAFDGIGHLVAPVICDPAHAFAGLSWCVAEMDERLKAMSKFNLRGIGAYNNAVRNAVRQGRDFKRSVQTGFDPATGRAVFEDEFVTPRPMPYLVVAIDDLDLVLETGGESVGKIFQRLGQSARAAGIHILAAASRLDGAAWTKGVAAMMPARVSFRLPAKADSRLAIGVEGAEALLADGDLLFSIGGAPVRGQAPMLQDGDIAQVAEWVRRQAPPQYEAVIATARLGVPFPAPLSTDPELLSRAATA